VKKVLNLIVIFIVCLSLACTSSYAQQYDFTVNFAWDANSEYDLAGYRLYPSEISGQYDYTAIPVATIPADTETSTVIYTFEGPQLPITYYWVLTAYDTEGLESGPSNEVTKTFMAAEIDPPKPPKNLKIV